MNQKDDFQSQSSVENDELLTIINSVQPNQLDFDQRSSDESIKEFENLNFHEENLSTKKDIFESDSFFTENLENQQIVELSKSDLENFELFADKGFEDVFAEKLKTDAYFSSTEDMSSNYFEPIDGSSVGQVDIESNSLDENFDALAARPQPEKSEDAKSIKSIEMSTEELRFSPLIVYKEQELFWQVKKYQSENRIAQENEVNQGKKKKQSIFKRGKKLFSFGRKRSKSSLYADDFSGNPTTAKKSKSKKSLHFSSTSNLSNTYRRNSNEDIDPNSLVEQNEMFENNSLFSSALTEENISRNVETSSKSQKKRRPFSLSKMLNKSKTKSVSMPNINEDNVKASIPKKKMKFSFKPFSSKAVYVVNPVDPSKNHFLIYGSLLYLFDSIFLYIQDSKVNKKSKPDDLKVQEKSHSKQVKNTTFGPGIC